LRKMAGEVGFEPTTPNLGGWCSIRDPQLPTQHPQLSQEGEILKGRTSIRAELLAHPQYIQQLPRILHLEGKGRSPNTITAYAKALKALALRADLKDTEAVGARFPVLPTSDLKIIAFTEAQVLTGPADAGVKVTLYY
jgi:hypothetical protein